jgi:hypothetical protein
MADSLASGRYTVTWRDNQWVVRAPDGKTHSKYGDTRDDHARAGVMAERLNQKLRAADQR